MVNLAVGMIFVIASLMTLGRAAVGCFEPEGNNASPFVLELVLVALGCLLGAAVSFNFIPG